MATTTPRQRFVLLVSIALIAADWTSSALGFLLGRMFGVIVHAAMNLSVMAGRS